MKTNPAQTQRACLCLCARDKQVPVYMAQPPVSTVVAVDYGCSKTVYTVSGHPPNISESAITFTWNPDSSGGPFFSFNFSRASTQARYEILGLKPLIPLLGTEGCEEEVTKLMDDGAMPWCRYVDGGGGDTRSVCVSRLDVANGDVRICMSMTAPGRPRKTAWVFLWKDMLSRWMDNLISKVRRRRRVFLACDVGVTSLLWLWL